MLGVSEFVEGFMSMSDREQRESVGDLYEQAELLRRVRMLFVNCEEFGDEIDLEDLRRAAWGE